MPEPRREIKDSVFTFLFKQPEYLRELYLTLHPEDEDVTEDDIKLVTVEPVLTAGLYNDLGFQVRETLFILMEAQSTFSINIVMRIFLYLAETYKEYIGEQGYDLYAAKPIEIPRPELYVVYTGDRREVPEVLRLSELYKGQGSVDLEVKILRNETSGDIIAQYVRFCKIMDANVKIYGRTQKALDETIKQCIEENILAPFLMTRKKEVTDIMAILFSHDEIMEMHDRSIRRESLAEGIQLGEQRGRTEGEERRDRLYSELISILMPLGRIDDILAATTDKTKLAALAKEFGLSI